MNEETLRPTNPGSITMVKFPFDEDFQLFDFLRGWCSKLSTRKYDLPQLYRGSSLIRNSAPKDPTVGLCLGPKATWKREFKLPWRKAGLLISIIQWTRTSRLSIKISLSASGPMVAVGGVLF